METTRLARGVLEDPVSPRACLIIRLIIHTIRRGPSGSVQIDDPSNVSSPDPSGADQIDVEHQATGLAVGGSNSLAARRTPRSHALSGLDRRLAEATVNDLPDSRLRPGIPQGPGKVAIRPHCAMLHVVARRHATALVRAGARLQRQGCSGVGGRPRPCRDPGQTGRPESPSSAVDPSTLSAREPPRSGDDMRG